MRYVYRAVYQHNGKDAGLVGVGCESVSKDRCREFAMEQTRGRGVFRVRRYMVPATRGESFLARHCFAPKDGTR